MNLYGKIPSWFNENLLDVKLDVKLDVEKLKWQNVASNSSKHR
jgi:hypothetical protein